MLGLRWGIGPDFSAYRGIFLRAQFFSLGQALSHTDPGYYTLMWAVHAVNAPFWWVDLICGLFLLGGLTAFSLRRGNPWLSLLVALPYLIIVVGMSGNRQSIAIGLLCFGLNAFERGQVTRFMAFACLAAAFHASAMLVIPVCLLAYSRNALHASVLLVVTIFLMTYGTADAMAVYIRRYSDVSLQSTGVYYRLAMNGLAAIVFLALRNRFSAGHQQRLLWRNIALVSLGLACLLLIVPSSTAIDRFLLYLFPLQLVVAGDLPIIVPEGRGRLPLTMAVVSYAAAVQLAFLVFGTFASAYVPYESIFSPVDVHHIDYRI